MKKLRKTLQLILCLGAVVMLLPMTALAGMGNNGTMSGSGTWAIDIDNNQNGVIVSGNYTKTVYNNGGLIVGGNFTNPIVDNGEGRYGLQLQLSNAAVDNGPDIYEYAGIKYGVMPYNADFTFKISPDSSNGYSLPKSIIITRAGSELSPVSDYSYNTDTGAVTIKAAVINYPLVLEAAGKVVEAGLEINEENFPDATFRKYVEDEFDLNNSGILTDDEINKIKKINVGLQTSTTNITTLKGIEFFPYLEELQCLDVRPLSSLDISENKALKELSIEGSADIHTLDVGQNTELEYINCGYTSVTNLNLNSNKKLKQLYINATGIEQLDLSENADIEVLNCFKAANLTSLDLSDKPFLYYLEIGGTGIKEIDTSGNPLLSSFFCSDTQITSLDVSKNAKLSSFTCKNNKLGFLNLGTQSIHPALFNLDTQVTTEMKISGGEFDITEKFKGIDSDKIKIISGAIRSGDVISGYQAGVPVIYEYNCGTNKGESVILTVTLNLIKSESSVIINKNPGKIYDGEPVSLSKENLTITGSKGAVSFTWEIFDGTNWAALESAPYAVGTYRVTAHVAEDEYYSQADSEAQEFAIEKQEETNPQDRPQDKPKDENSAKGNKQGKAVQTGDTSVSGMFAVLSILSGAGIMLLMNRRKKAGRN